MRPPAHFTFDRVLYTIKCELSSEKLFFRKKIFAADDLEVPMSFIGTAADDVK